MTYLIYVNSSKNVNQRNRMLINNGFCAKALVNPS